VEVDVEAARAQHDVAEVAELRKKEEQLRKKEEQLRKEKEQLRKEKEQLRTKELLLLERTPSELQTCYFNLSATTAHPCGTAAGLTSHRQHSSTVSRARARSL